MTRLVRIGRYDIEARAVALFVALDLLTYALLYWLVLPAFDEVLDVLDSTTQAAIGHVLTAVRLTFIGAITVRSIRSRHGLVSRSEAVPTVVVAALAAFVLQVLLGVVATLVVGASPWTWLILLNLVEWVVFALLGAAFVTPGDADRIPARFFRPAGDRGAVSMLIAPAVAGLLAVTLLAIVVIGSAASDRRESSTAADAAALAAVDVWRDALELRFLSASGASDADGFWALVCLDLADLAPPTLTSAARSYAEANDSELISLSVDPGAASVTVRVRNNETVPGSDRRVESEATARIDLLSGLCRSGRHIGYLVSGVCRTSAPEPEPTPTPTDTPTEGADPGTEPTPPPPPPPFEAPDGLGGFRARTVLTR